MTIQAYILLKKVEIADEIVDLDSGAFSPYQSDIENILATKLLEEAVWIKDQIVNDQYRQIPNNKCGTIGYSNAIANRNKKLKELGFTL